MNSARVRLGVSCLLVLGAVSAASAQEVTVAALPWTFGQTAGVKAQTYAGTGGTDLYVCEDLSTQEPFALSTFRCTGWIQPQGAAGLLQDVNVQILDDYPPNGQVVLESVAGKGIYKTVGSLSSSYYETSFEGQVLPAGDYVVMWSAHLPSTTGICLMWHQPGAHSVGGGLPDNGFWWEPSTGSLIPVPLQLGGGGNSGVNFVLKGEAVSCYADCDESGGLDFFDFLCFQNEFAFGEPYADCDASGTLDFFDFLCFQNEFAAGCP